ncbi:unnamed protein product [Callosobruchus maculatus]
MGKFG